MTLLMHVPTWPLAPFLCMNAHAEPIVALGPYEAQQIGSLRSCDQQQQQLGPICTSFQLHIALLEQGADAPVLCAIVWNGRFPRHTCKHAAAGHIGGLLSGGLLSWGISPLYDADDIDLDNRELAAERASKMASKSLAQRHKAEQEAAELAAKDLAVDKTSIWAKLLFPVGYASLFVGSVVYILHDRIGHLPAAKWLPDLF